jgi:putative holliday junction resolvase
MAVTAGSANALKTPGKVSPARRVLALDYGRRRIGMAISDEMGITAKPLAVLERTNRRHDLRRLREIARQQGVRLIIVGHPLHLDGAVSEMAQECARFAVRVRKELGIEVTLADERLTSHTAKEMLAARSLGARRGRDAVDDVAAAILLRDYLDGVHTPARAVLSNADAGTRKG